MHEKFLLLYIIPIFHIDFPSWKKHFIGMTIQEYLKSINKLQLKQLVYRELISYLNKYMKSDTNEAELFIPVSAEAFLGEDIDVTKTVPEHYINEVSLEIQKVIDKTQDEINKLLNKELK